MVRIVHIHFKISKCFLPTGARASSIDDVADKGMGCVVVRPLVSFTGFSGAGKSCCSLKEQSLLR